MNRTALGVLSGQGLSILFTMVAVGTAFAEPPGMAMAGLVSPSVRYTLIALALAVLIVETLPRSLLLKVMPENLSFPLAMPEYVEGLDLEALQKYTNSLEASGFVRAMDYRLEAEGEVSFPGFGRLFIHPAHQCYGEVNQVVLPNGRGLPMRCAITSSLERGWLICTTDRDPDPVNHVLRNPQVLWVSRPDELVQDLLHGHIVTRGQIASDLNAGVTEELSTAAYLALQQQEIVAQREVIKRRSMSVALVEAFLFALRPRYEWLGDYPRIAAGTTTKAAKVRRRDARSDAARA